MLSKWIVYALVLFNLCGFYTEFFKTAIHRKISNVAFVFHIVLALFLTVFSIQIQIWMDSHIKKLDMINGFCQYVCSLIAHWTIIAESYIQRKNQQEFWQLLQNIDCHHAQHNQIKPNSYFFKLLEYFSFYFVLTIYFFDDIQNDGVFCAVNILLLLCQNRLFYYLFYMELINFELKFIVNEIRRTFEGLEEEGFCKNTNLKCFEQMRLKWLREYYQLIHALSGCVNSVFGWSNFATVVYTFVFLVTEINWTYKHFQTGDVDAHTG